MKRIIIIFIIAFCLLNFTGISYSNEEPKKFGELWNSFSNIQKVTCILVMDYGITKGIDICLQGYQSYFSERGKGERWQLGLAGLSILNDYLEIRSTFDIEVISKVVTELYKDPANTYIWISDMYIIALRKVKGEDIEPLLQEARKKALLEELEK
ncbi:hypothetical protein ES705_34160 [subsurface metagenome]|jgi:hypothetical protein